MRVNITHRQLLLMFQLSFGTSSVQIRLRVPVHPVQCFLIVQICLCFHDQGRDGIGMMVQSSLRRFYFQFSLHHPCVTTPNSLSTRNQPQPFLLVDALYALHVVIVVLLYNFLMVGIGRVIVFDRFYRFKLVPFHFSFLNVFVGLHLDEATTFWDQQ